MAMTLIVDASVAVKWFLQESDSAAALALRGRDSLIAPDFILLETHYVVWRSWRRGETTFDAVEGVIKALNEAFEHIEQSTTLLADAARISLGMTHPIYDCLYIAHAQRERATLITADEKQFAVARKAKISVELL
jgi:predicted nucleic acid-binding protein